MRDELTGVSDRVFVELLSAQIDAALDGGRLAHEAITGAVSSVDAREQMGAIEHAGDGHRAELVTRLTQALSTPFDREDIFRLSRSIDDVLDNLRDFVREADLMGVQDPRHFSTLIDAIIEALEKLKVAVAHVLDEPHLAPERALGVKKGSNHVRQLYQVAIAALFEEELSVWMLKRRELLRRLDVVGLRLGEAADALSDGALKRS